MNNINLYNIHRNIILRPTRSHWDRAINYYALLLIDKLRERLAYDDELEITADNFLKIALDGARNWQHYSQAGCALICEYDIARIVCTQGEFKRKCSKRGGMLPPNALETWLDVQGRALAQAANLILNLNA